MTYHFDPRASPKKRSLYVALEIVAVGFPVQRERFLTPDVISKIPRNQMEAIVTACRQAGVDVSLQSRDASAFDTEDFLTIEDYAFLVDQTDPVSAEATLAAPSVQTIAALEILLTIQKKGRVWATDDEMRQAVENRVRHLAGRRSVAVIRDLHYACNCLGLSGLHEREFLLAKGRSNALERIYGLEGIP